MSSNSKYSMRAPLAKARGLGSANEGSHHWWMSRMTSLILVPLTFWLVTTGILMIGQPYEVARAWFGNLFVATFLVITLVTLFYHSILGLQVILEDYIHHEGWRTAVILLTKAVLYVLGGITILASLRMAFGY